MDKFLQRDSEQLYEEGCFDIYPHMGGGGSYDNKNETKKL